VACERPGGKIKLSARASNFGVATLSGIEVWSGDGPVPQPERPKFADAPTPDQVAFFESKIRPVLADHCLRMPQRERQENQSRPDARFARGRSKKVVVRPAATITPADPDASLLIQAIRPRQRRHRDAAKAKLTPEQVAAFIEG